MPTVNVMRLDLNLANSLLSIATWQTARRVALPICWFVCLFTRADVVALSQEKNIDTYMFERKMDNCKPCGGAIPLCMIDEFKLPQKIVDRKVLCMLLRLPSTLRSRELVFVFIAVARRSFASEPCGWGILTFEKGVATHATRESPVRTHADETCITCALYWFGEPR